MRGTPGKRYRNATVKAPPRICITAILLRAACVATLALPFPALAGLYKCARDDGTVMYQEDPCPPGRELRDFERDPATVSVVPFRMVPEAPPPATTNRSGDAGAKNERSKASKSTQRSGSATERSGNASERKFLVPGISEGEVVARIGRPDMTSGNGRKTLRWTYMPVPEDPGTITTLTFDMGRLVQVERKVIRTP